MDLSNKVQGGVGEELSQSPQRCHQGSMRGQIVSSYHERDIKNTGQNIPALPYNKSVCMYSKVSKMHDLVSSAVISGDKPDRNKIKMINRCDLNCKIPS